VSWRQLGEDVEDNCDEQETELDYPHHLDFELETSQAQAQQEQEALWKVP
jgi:hypothetical protein